MNRVVQYYDQIAANYDHDRFENSYGKYINHCECSILGSWLEGSDAAQTVDFGCGTGRMLRFAYYGIDASHEMLKIAKQKYPDRTLLAAPLTKIPLPSQSILNGLCFHVLMHLEQDQIRQFLSEAARVTKKNGSLIIDFPGALRRRLFRRTRTEWHGNTSFDLPTLLEWAEGQWKVRRWRGIIFFPVHRIPSPLRKYFAAFDLVLGRTWLGRLSSYYVVELERTA